VNTLRLNKNIIPLSEFRASLSPLIEKLNETRDPLLLTQHGKGVAMVVDVDEFEEMRERLEVLEDIEAVRGDIAQGRVYSQEEAKARLLSRLS